MWEDNTPDSSTGKVQFAKNTNKSSARWSHLCEGLDTDAVTIKIRHSSVCPLNENVPAAITALTGQWLRTDYKTLISTECFSCRQLTGMKQYFHQSQAWTLLWTKESRHLFETNVQRHTRNCENQELTPEHKSRAEQSVSILRDGTDLKLFLSTWEFCW